jgi:KUP system potassium uptake protein
LERYGAIPKDIVFLTVQKGKTPFAGKDRYQVYPLFASKKYGSISGVTLTFGFMEEQNVEAVLSELAKHHMLNLPTNPDQWSFHVAHERVYVEEKATFIQKLRFTLFKLMLKNSQPADEYLGLGLNHRLTIQTVPVKIG